MIASFAMDGFPSPAGLPPAFFVIVIAIFGGLAGSFLNVVIHRVPLKRSIVTPRSACPSCGALIAWYDNFPVLSWLVLRAKCRSCGARISARYPLVELLTSALFVGVWYRFGLAPHTFVYMGLVAVFVALTFIDIDHRIIPNVISLPGIVIGLALSFVLPRVPGSALPPYWLNSLVGALLGGGVLWLTAEIYFRVRGVDGMGMGDVKMLGMIGAFLGAWPTLPFVIFVSAITGTAVGIVVMVLSGQGRKTAIPFGPFLALAATLYLFIGPEVMDLYMASTMPPPPT